MARTPPQLGKRRISDRSIERSSPGLAKNREIPNAPQPDPELSNGEGHTAKNLDEIEETQQETQETQEETQEGGNGMEGGDGDDVNDASME